MDLDHLNAVCYSCDMPSKKKRDESQKDPKDRITFFGGKRVSDIRVPLKTVEFPNIDINVCYLRKIGNLSEAAAWRLAEKAAQIASARWPKAWVSMDWQEEQGGEGIFLLTDYSASTHTGEDWDMYFTAGPKIKDQAQRAILRETLNKRRLS